MISKSLVTVLTVLAVLHYAKCEIKTVSYNLTAYVTCNPANASGENVSECPKDSQCIDVKGYGKHIDSKNTTEGLCSCKPNFMVNRKFSKDNGSVYCIEREDSHTSSSTALPIAPPTTQPTPVSSSSTTKAPVSTVKTSTSTSTTAAATSKVETTTAKTESNDNVDIKPAPEPRKGFFASILVPVMIVLGLIGMIFAARKYNMVDRTRNYLRNRGNQQHQTRYDGLENDFDDDPLLI